MKYCIMTYVKYVKRSSKIIIQTSGMGVSNVRQKPRNIFLILRGYVFSDSVKNDQLKPHFDLII